MNLEDKLTLRQIKTNNVASGLILQAKQILKELENELVAAAIRIDPASAKQRRSRVRLQNELDKESKLIYGEAYKKMRNLLNPAMDTMSEKERDFIIAALGEL